MRAKLCFFVYFCYELSQLSNLSYDLGLPQSRIEMIFSLIVMSVQIYLSALILGMLQLVPLAMQGPGECAGAMGLKVACIIQPLV